MTYRLLGKHSVDENAQVVMDYLEAEKRREVLLGPFLRVEVPSVHINCFGIIPKSGQPGKWRLIVDLSHPKERSYVCYHSMGG